MLRSFHIKGDSASRRPRVALLIESSRAYGRGTLMGVAKYVRQHGPWSIFFQERGLGDSVLAAVERALTVGTTLDQSSRRDSVAHF